MSGEFRAEVRDWLAAIWSRAVRSEGGWIVSGTKTWCSRAAFADRAFGLFRTDPGAERPRGAAADRHSGLSYLLFGLRAPGVTVRPIRQLGGRTGFAEIFLDEVFVPDGDVVGEPGDGWRIAMSTASHERGLSLRSPGRFLAAAGRLAGPAESPRASTEFAAALHDMLGDADVPAASRRWADGDLAPGLALWRRLAGLGVTALAVPENRGGLAASPLDLVAVCEELGHHAVPGPAAESLAAVPALLAGLADPGGPPGACGERGLHDGRGACGEWLAALAAGDLIATLAVPPWLPFAADAEAAGLVLLAQDGVVYRGHPGARHQSVDPARSLSEVRDGEVLARDTGADTSTARALDAGALACSAQLLGAGRALLEASVRHVRTREQFGRPVGAFQAVKHKLADVAIGLEFARPLLDAAALALDDTELATTGTAARDVSAAKVACADAAYLAARAALQVHGAIGYTAELDLSLWLAKVRALVPAWGSQAEHRARVLRELGDGVR